MRFQADGDVCVSIFLHNKKMTCDKVFERVITETSDTSLEDTSSLHIPVNDSIIL